MLTRGETFTPGSHELLIGAAPWSDPDLAVLEDLVSVVRGRTVQVTVFNIDDLSLDEMRRLFPEGRLFRDTPFVMHYRDGKLIWFGEGRDAAFWLRQF